MADPILLLHLGDIHFRNVDSPILNRVDDILGAIRAQRLAVSDCFVLVAGDIAFSGQAAEYALAESFFSELLSRLRQELPGLKPQVVFVPGNHDCSLVGQSDIRQAGLSSSQVARLELEGGFIREFLAVQNAFWEFTGRFGQVHATSKDRLHSRKVFVTGEKTIAFTCINSAWMSTNPESFGKLLYPNHLHCPIEDLSADAEIVMMHHPPHWMDPDNGRILRDSLERRADLIFTGHEHLHEAFTKTSASTNIEYVAGRAMFDARASENGFNLITLDLEARQWTTASLTWDGTQYRSDGTATKSTFLRNRALLEQGFQNNQKFLNDLTDIGTGFTHERKHLRLSDVFVYPNLLHRVYQRNLDGKVISPRRIRHKDVASFLLSERRVLILGANRSGKSALARTIYRVLQSEKQLVPLLIKGSDLTADCQLATVLDSAYKHQYSHVSLERFKQLSKERICLIIDDLHKLNIGLKGQTKLVARLEQMFGTLIFLAHDLFDVDRILAGHQHPLFYEYRQYTIEEFNRVQRGALIEKWLALGRSDWEQETQLQAEVEAKEKVINTLLGRQLVPAHPIVILAFLQAMESMRTPNTASGSYGELYESLITDRLALVSKKATDISIKYALISRMAYMMYDRDATSLLKDDIEEICDQYFGEYQIRRSGVGLIADLLEAGIIREVAGNYQFVYPYYFHFFVARYFRDKVDDSVIGPNLRGRLTYMADRVYFEDYANIIVFYLYLKKDTDIIEHILGNASKIYNSHAPCTLEDKVVDDLNKLALSPPQAVALLSEDIKRNRDEFRRSLDELEEQSPKGGNGEKLVYSEDLSEFAQLNISFKTIHILGQVLRSFPGDIKKELKIRIADQCYLLGLRMLSMALGAISSNSDYLRMYFTQLLLERHIDGSAAMLSEVATNAILDLAVLWAFAVVKTLSNAVGVEELSETYKEVLGMHQEILAVQVIDSSIKLDHFGAFPDAQLERLHKRTRKTNYIAFCAIRNLLLTHYQLYRSNHVLKAKFTTLYSFDMRATKLVEGGLTKQ